MRVWYSDAPDELCGFAFLMDQLTQIHFGGPVWAVKQPCPNISPDGSANFIAAGARSGRSTGSPSPGWRGLSPQKSRPHGAVSGRDCAGKTRRSRAVVNGRLTSVPTDFYDSILRQEIRGLEAEFDAAFLIGRTICRLPALGDAIIALRVQEMIDRGELAVIGTDAAPDGAVYWRRLRRTDVFPQK